MRKKGSLLPIVFLLIFTLGKQANLHAQDFELGTFEKSEPIELKYQFPSAIKNFLDTCSQPWAGQSAATDYSFIGKEKECGELFYGPYGKPKAMSDSLYKLFQSKYTATNAKEYILERTKSERVVIINEAHHKPKHRFFTKSLLKDLYEQGYRYLGLEALGNLYGRDSSLNERGYATYQSGYYIKEPQFAQLVREALAIGYTVFPYEGEGNGKPREINQAKNIAEFMANNPNGKYLIHCGYDHATEGPIESWEKAMAGRLSEYTGINPLTINQTKYDNRFDSAYLPPLMKQINIDEPTVFVDSNNLSYLGERNDSAFDIMVFHEQANYFRERPDWLVQGENRWISLDLDSLSLELPFIAMAFDATEEMENSIPYDLDFAEDKKQINLALRAGKYILHLQNQNDSAYSLELEVFED